MQLVSKATLPRVKHRAATLVYFFMSGFGYSTWASRIPTIKAFFGFNDAQLGTILLFMPVSSLLGLPVSGCGKQAPAGLD